MPKALNQITNRTYDRLILIFGCWIASIAVSDPRQLAAQTANSDNEKIILQATQELNRGNWEKAFELYQTAKERGSSDPRITYNQAVASYQKGNTLDASQLFAEVVSQGDKELAARSRFNMGNCDYKEAISKVQTDPQGSLKLIESAIQHYRQSLASTPDDMDARANIEIAHKLKRSILRQQQSQPSQDDQNSQRENSPPKEQEQEKESTEPSKEGNNSSDNQPQQQPDPGEKTDPLNQPSDSQEKQNSPEGNSESQSESEKQEDANNQPSQNPIGSDSNPTDDPSSDSQKPSKSPDAQTNENNNGQPQNGTENTPPPEGDLKPLNDAPNGQTSDSRSVTPQQEKIMTLDEAQKMLQAVRDRELRRRIQKLRQMQLQRVPVDKDW